MRRLELSHAVVIDASGGAASTLLRQHSASAERRFIVRSPVSGTEPFTVPSNIYEELFGVVGRLDVDMTGSV